MYVLDDHLITVFYSSSGELRDTESMQSDMWDVTLNGREFKELFRGGVVQATFIGT